MTVNTGLILAALPSPERIMSICVSIVSNHTVSLTSDKRETTETRPKYRSSTQRLETAPLLRRTPVADARKGCLHGCRGGPAPMLQPMRVQRSHRRQVPLDPGLPSGPSLADDDVLKA